MAAMVNMNSLLNGKDSRWLQLEVCREFQRNKCSRQDTECKFAHPPANVEVQNGKVTACYDSIKGRCNRDKPPCKYFHPPQHLKDQLLINGRNHLALKNALMQQMGITPGQPVIAGQVPQVATNPYLTGIPANTYSTYFAPGHIVPALLGHDPSAVTQLGPVLPQVVQIAQQKIPRSDRLEAPVSVSTATLTQPMPTTGAVHPHPPPPFSNITAAVGLPLEVGKKRAAESDLFQLAFSGMVPYKRPAAEKSGIPVYQPGASTYQQLMQFQQPPFVPVSCEYLSENLITTSTTNTATTYAATATPQPQTSITTTASTTSATTSASTTMYTPSNYSQLNFTEPNISSTVISQNNHVNNQANSSGNSATAPTIATNKTRASNFNNYNNLYNYSSSSHGNNNIKSYINNTNKINRPKLSTTATVTTSVKAIEASIDFTKATSDKDLHNGGHDREGPKASCVFAVYNGNAEDSNSCPKFSENYCTSNVEYQNEDAALFAKVTSSQSSAFLNDGDNGDDDDEKKDCGGNETTKITFNHLSNLLNKGINSRPSKPPLLKNDGASSFAVGVGILRKPTSMLEASSSTSPSHSYRAQQDKQSLCNIQSLSKNWSTPHATILKSLGTSTLANISTNQYSTQSLALPSSYGNIASTAGAPTYSYTNSPYYYAQSTAGGSIACSYHEASSLAKVAQNNSANAIKVASASNALFGKPIGTPAVLNYTGMSISKTYVASPQAASAAVHAAMTMAAATNPHHAVLMQVQQQQMQAQAVQQQAAHAHAVATAAAAAQMRSVASLPGSCISTPIGTPVHTPAATSSFLQRPSSSYIQTGRTTVLRPKTMQLSSPPQSFSSANNYTAVTASVNQKYATIQQQSFFYPGIMTSASYPYAAMGTMQTMSGAIGLPAITQMVTEAPTTTGSAMVLNPFKKMKTS